MIEMPVKYKATIVVAPHHPGFAEVTVTEDVYRVWEVDRLIRAEVGHLSGKLKCSQDLYQQTLIVSHAKDKEIKRLEQRLQSTVEDRKKTRTLAAEAFDEAYAAVDRGGEVDPYDKEIAILAIMQIIQSEVEAEREACAKVAEQVIITDAMTGMTGYAHGNTIAQVLRQRRRR